MLFQMKNYVLHLLIDYKETLWNKAPEVRKSSECWIPLQNILNKQITNFDDDWKIQLLNIFNG